LVLIIACVIIKYLYRRRKNHRHAALSGSNTDYTPVPPKGQVILTTDYASAESMNIVDKIPSDPLPSAVSINAPVLVPPNKDFAQ